MSERCEMRANGRAWVQNMQSAVAVSGNYFEQGGGNAQNTEQAKAGSPVEVTIDGLNLRIDDSEASCASLHYDSGLAAARLKDAHLNVVFKVLLSTSASSNNDRMPRDAIEPRDRVGCLML